MRSSNPITSILPLLAIAGMLPVPQDAPFDESDPEAPTRNSRNRPPFDNAVLRDIKQKQADNAAFYRAERARRKAEQFEKQHKGKSQKT